MAVAALTVFSTPFEGTWSNSSLLMSVKKTILNSVFTLNINKVVCAAKLHKNEGNGKTNMNVSLSYALAIETLVLTGCNTLPSPEF